MKAVEYTEDEEEILRRHRVFAPQIVQTRQQAKIKNAEAQERAAVKEAIRLKRNDPNYMIPKSLFRDDQQITQFGNKSSAKDIAASYGFLNKNTDMQK